MEKEKKKLKIKIFDKVFILVVEDEIIGKEAANYVDKMMRELHKEMPTESFQQIALLCALNISYELFDIKKNGFKNIDKIKEKIDQIKLLFSVENDNPSM